MSVQTMSIKEFMAGNSINRRKQKKAGKLVRRIGTSIAMQDWVRFLQRALL
ncbi:hypothetical protein ACFFHH_16210 [Cytobacillus solani]|uniref:hypothetical protein n=1 Tax=Cytobacillus solani TaxID=1637975 RepID=UPI000A92C38D|nr:hypothetical protein [Cytobacillus solani]